MEARVVSLAMLHDTARDNVRNGTLAGDGIECLHQHLASGGVCCRDEDGMAIEYGWFKIAGPGKGSVLQRANRFAANPVVFARRHPFPFERVRPGHTVEIRAEPVVGDAHRKIVDLGAAMQAAIPRDRFDDAALRPFSAAQ